MLDYEKLNIDAMMRTIWHMNE
ncbi:hypothetical protein AERO8C_90091 [Aeromonas veronii]|uniref:Uncharacterized protein n=1 Tax=Aeromonas veronii TaxID=654 RepID=A0A653LEH5_AERVE|nr:hypothetical protein AERO8C_90091 [Aeromonas veronii]